MVPKMPAHQRRTWIELLVVFALLVAIIAVLVPLITRERDRSARVMCMNQLRAIGQCILLYSNDNRGAWPRTRASTRPVRVPTWGTGAAATQPFTDPNGPADNDVSAAIFLLARTQDITGEVFICPASNARADTYAGLTPVQRSNFTDIKRNLSYGYQNPYPSDSAIETSRRGVSIRLPDSSAYAIAADINPGTGAGIAPTTMVAVRTSSTLTDTLNGATMRAPVMMATTSTLRKTATSLHPPSITPTPSSCPPMID
jgi:type II secretory pathway pseudopilin PulG